MAIRDRNILSLAAQIVSAHVSNNRLEADQLPPLIEAVARALQTAGEQAQQAPKRQPAVPIKESVEPDTIACLECGKRFRTLKRHLARDHGITEAEYRERWNLPSSYKLSAPNYAKLRADVARRIGLGRTGRHGGWKAASHKS